MKAYLYLFKNSFFEQNQTPLSFFAKTFQPLIVISGYAFFYQFILQKSDFNVLAYYSFLLLVYIVDVPRFGFEIKRDIQSEKYLMIDRLPIHPFNYYLMRSLGRSVYTFIASLILSTVAFVYLHYSFTQISIILICASISIVLLHLCSFLFAQIIFYIEHFHIWISSISFDFLSGRIIPFILVPPLLQSVLIWFVPLGTALGGPALFVTNRDFSPLLVTNPLTILWIFVLYWAVKKLWDRGGFYFQDHN
jgi:ABC-type uncharacterized transport system permease subunit